MADTFSKAERSRIMAAVQGTNTSIELKLRRALHRLGYRYSVNVKTLPGKPDIVLKRYRTVIFVHGCFWHLHGCERTRIPASNRDYWVAKLERNRKRDRRHRRELRALGWRVIVVWECQLKDISRDLRRIHKKLQESCEAANVAV